MPRLPVFKPACQFFVLCSKISGDLPSSGTFTRPPRARQAEALEKMRDERSERETLMEMVKLLEERKKIRDGATP